MDNNNFMMNNQKKELKKFQKNNISIYSPCFGKFYMSNQKREKKTSTTTIYKYTQRNIQTLFDSTILDANCTEIKTFSIVLDF